MPFEFFEYVFMTFGPERDVSEADGLAFLSSALPTHRAAGLRRKSGSPGAVSLCAASQRPPDQSSQMVFYLSALLFFGHSVSEAVWFPCLAMWRQ
jgi:hypothetical protein